MIGIWRLWRRIGGWRGILAQAYLASRLMRDPRVPFYAKLIIPAALLYFFSPINLSFEWIPFLGQIDDVGIAMLALGAFLRACPPDVVVEHAHRLEQETGRRGRRGDIRRFLQPSFDRWTKASPPGGSAPGTP